MRTWTRWTGLTYRNRLRILTLVSYTKTGRCRIVKRTMDDEADPCKFPVPTDQFPVRAKKIPGSESNRESACIALELPRESTEALPKKGAKMAGIRKIPCYFPCW